MSTGLGGQIRESFSYLVSKQDASEIQCTDKASEGGSGEKNQLFDACLHTLKQQKACSQYLCGISSCRENLLHTKLFLFFFFFLNEKIAKKLAVWERFVSTINLTRG